MPIYEYTCQKCHAHVEVMQKVSDKPLTRHAKCGGKLEKQWSATSFQFKGAGWYVTDYAGKKSDAKESAETKETKETKDTKETAVASEKSATPAVEKSKEKKPKASAAAASGD
ncbi:MAG TPA: FmdB family zinc ribbon protein [Pyrinomonadaceae bacterium]|nr:FmdB family zinc ribbon protein [Pyrinomonadaceae bacterium]